MSLTWKEREKHLARAYVVIARLHNALEITPPIPEDVSNYGGRPYLVFEAPDLIRDIIDGFTDEEVKAIKHGLGSVNQFVDSTNQVSNNALCEMLKPIDGFDIRCTFTWPVQPEMLCRVGPDLRPSS